MACWASQIDQSCASALDVRLGYTPTGRRLISAEVGYIIVVHLSNASNAAETFFGCRRLIPRINSTPRPHQLAAP